MKTILFYFATFAMIFASCGGGSKPSKEKQLVGGSDVSAGYTYSKVLDKKIRIFEEGVRMLSVTEPMSSFAGYVVFAKDSSKVELFLPKQTVVLDRRNRPDGTKVWNVEDDDTYMLEKKDGDWIVTRRGNLIYSSAGIEEEED